MITEIQTVVGATQFTGVAGAGLIRFEDFLDLPETSPDIVPILTNVALQGDNVTTVTTINAFLQRQGGAATERLLIRFLGTAETGFTLAGCRIPVPRDFSSLTAGPPWELQLITTGKTIDMSLIASFETGQAIVDDG